MEAGWVNAKNGKSYYHGIQPYLDKLAQELASQKQELVGEIEKMKYKYRHHHDFQIGVEDDNKYHCTQCRLPLTDFDFPKDKYKEKWCSHFRSFNQAISELLAPLKESK